MKNATLLDAYLKQLCIQETSKQDEKLNNIKNKERLQQNGAIEAIKSNVNQSVYFAV